LNPFFKKNHISLLLTDETIKVCVRIRPLLEEELKKQAKSCLEDMDGNNTYLTGSL